MEGTLTAPETRGELFDRLSDAMTDDQELSDLIAFLLDDLPFAPDNRSIVGAVLRDAEFDPWRNLTAEVEQPNGVSDVERVRNLSGKLLTAMRA